MLIELTPQMRWIKGYSILPLCYPERDAYLRGPYRPAALPVPCSNKDEDRWNGHPDSPGGGGEFLGPIRRL